MIKKNNKKGISLFYVVIMMAVVMSLSTLMLSAALYNTTIAKVAGYNFELRTDLDQIGQDFIDGQITLETVNTYTCPYEIILIDESITVKKNNIVLLTVTKTGDKTNSWVYGRK